MHLIGVCVYLLSVPKGIYLPFLFRLLLTVQQQMEVEGGDNQKEQWRELVGDLWERRLPHLQEVVYMYDHGAFVYDPYTGRHGFQESSEYDSKEELMNDIMNEPEGEGHAEDSFVSLEDQQLLTGIINFAEKSLLVWF